MKKHITLGLAALLLLLVSLFLCCSAEGTGFKLPDSVLVIEESAFEGTGAREIVLPDGAVSIGERAFARIAALDSVYIPASIKEISDSAFAQSHSFTIYGLGGSRADDWAREHDIPFIDEAIWLLRPLLKFNYAVYLRLLACLVAAIVLIKLIRAHARRAGEGRSFRPQERAELYAIQLRFP